MTAKPPTVKDGTLLLENEWTGTWLAVEHLTGRLIAYDQPTKAAAVQVARGEQSFDGSKTRHCNGCNRDLPLSEECWGKRKTGFRRCRNCERHYAFRGLTGFMQRRILERKKQEVGRQS